MSYTNGASLTTAPFYMHPQRKSLDMGICATGSKYDMPRFGMEPFNRHLNNQSETMAPGTRFSTVGKHTHGDSTEFSLGSGTEELIRLRAESIME